MFSLNKVLAALGLTLVAVTTYGQSMPSAADSRYATPAEAASASLPTAGEPLISYRRDEVAPATANVEADAPARITKAPANTGDSNPLRQSPEPAPPQFPPIETMPMVERAAAPTTIPSAQPPSTPAVAQLPAAAPPFIAEPPVRYDPAVEPAALETALPAKADAAPMIDSAKPSTDSPRDLFTRRLAPLSSESSTEKTEAETNSKNSSLPFALSKLESFSTAGAGLAIVVGLFLVCMWMLRRGGAKPSGVLPSDAFAVLGRAPLTPQSFAHLLRLGNKLVLVAMSPDGIQPLTEVTDPMEVDRITGLCASGRGHGPSAEFQQVLAHLSREPARGFLGAEATASGGRRNYAA